MSQWDNLDMERIIKVILTKAESHEPGHHFGKPFLTAYQIAIEFARRYPNEFQILNKPEGGLGIGQKDSAAQYIANQLSTRISNKTIKNIEGCFLHRSHLRTLEYTGSKEQTITSSLGHSWDMSMFRLRDPKTAQSQV